VAEVPPVGGEGSLVVAQVREVGERTQVVSEMKRATRDRKWQTACMVTMKTAPLLYLTEIE
jgi:hypothetical protein